MTTLDENENGAGLATDAVNTLVPPILRGDDDYLPGIANMSTLSRHLDLFTDEGEAEWQRRIEVHAAMCEQAGMVPLLPGFTDTDLRGSDYRPWSGPKKPTDVSELMPSEIEKLKRFVAIRSDIAGDHYDRHWFYAHPMCPSCFPDDVWVGVDGHITTDPITEDRLGRWLLTHGAKFPVDTWDDVAPPMPHEDAVVDFLSDEDLDSMETPGWLIHETLPMNATGVLRARDQSYKSFMALSMALEVVLDGRKVLYCIGEGANQFKHRRDAWLEHHEATVSDLEGDLHYYPAVPNLFTGGEAYDRVLAKARREQYDLIVIDTYARATAGSEINSQADQSIVTTRVDELKRVSNGTVLLVAHSQKSDTDSSGSIEIEDARDFVFAMKRSGSQVTFEVTKQKDGSESARPTRYVAKEVGKSIVLVPACEDNGDGESIMTTPQWIIAALSEADGLGGRTEAQIVTWVNDHPHAKTLGGIKRGTLSSALNRMVKRGEVARSGSKYTLGADVLTEAPS